MRWPAAIVFTVAMIGAACAESGPPSSRPAPTATPATVPTAATSTTSGTPSTPIPTTGSTTAAPPASTPTTDDATDTLLDEPITLGPPDRALLPSAPPELIDWASVGAGWLLIDHPSGYGGPFIEPTVLDRRALYLVSPNDIVYGVSALPSDGHWIESVSRSGRTALFRLFDPVCAEGCSSELPATAEEYGFAVLDLPTRTLRPVIEPVPQDVFEPDFSRRAMFTDDAEGVFVSETWLADGGWRVTRVRLSRLDLASGIWTTILDEGADLDLLRTFGDRTDDGHASVVELPDGRLVTESPEGVWLRHSDGTALMQLDAPDTTCVLGGLWNSDDVLGRCRPPEVASPGCWTTGLYLVHIDGSPFTTLAAPADLDGRRACYSNYFDAIELDGGVAIQAGEGEGSCDHDVVFLGDDGVRAWEPDVDGPEGCVDERLLGVRNGSWLITTGVGVTYEVDRQGERVVALPQGQIIPIWARPI